MPWLPYAVGEALMRTITIVIYKVLGGLTPTIGLVALSTAVIGSVQVGVASVVLAVRRVSPFGSARHIVGSILFGIGAFFGTILPILSFSLGGSLGVYAFLTRLSIVPGAVIDRAFFGEAFTLRHALALMLAVGAGWLGLGMPSLGALLALPLWVGLGLINAGVLALNQGVTRWIKDVDTWVKNFWGGLATLVLSIVVISFVDLSIFDQALSGLHEGLLMWAVFAGLTVIGLWTFNVLAYRSGASIPAKNVVVTGLRLCTALILGYFLFNETVTIAQGFGVLGYVLAFLLLSPELLQRIVRIAKLNKRAP